MSNWHISFKAKNKASAKSALTDLATSNTNFPLATQISGLVDLLPDFADGDGVITIMSGGNLNTDSGSVNNINISVIFEPFK